MPIVALTTQYVRSLKPPESGRIEIWDERTPGLCLRMSSTGRAAWSFRYRPREGAGFQRITFGSLDDLGLADARERAAKQRSAVVDGRDPQRERVARREAVRNALTFDALAQRYIDEYAKPRKTSWQNDAGYLRRPREKWKDRPAGEVTRRDVIDLLDVVKATAPVSANRTQSILVTLFNWAVDGELIEVNPISRLKKRAKEAAKDRTLTDDEIRGLWKMLDTSSTVLPDVAGALRLLLLTGQRPGEIAGLLRSEILEIDRKNARVEISGARMKAGKAHVLPLAPMALGVIATALARRKADSEPADGKPSRPDSVAVFASRFVSRDSLARHSLSQGLRRLIAGLDADKVGAAVVKSLQAHPPTPHDFRRTVGTGLARLGIPREDRKAVLAHTEDDVHGRHYDRYERLAEKRAALELWERHVAALMARVSS